MTTIHPTLEHVLHKEGNYHFFKEGDYICAVLRMPSGNLNGYVAIPSTHPLFEKNYSDHCDNLSPVVFNGNYIGLLAMAFSETNNAEMTPINIYFNVHGGITFASSGLKGIEAGLFGNVWWFGFDTSHSGDLRPFQTEIDRMFPIQTDEYRSMAYVIEQTKSLAQQLLQYAHAKNTNQGAIHITVEQAANNFIEKDTNVNQIQEKATKDLLRYSFLEGISWKEQQMEEELGKEMELLDTLIQDGAFNSAAAHIHKLLIKYNSK